LAVFYPLHQLRAVLAVLLAYFLAMAGLEAVQDMPTLRHHMQQEQEIHLRLLHHKALMEELEQMLLLAVLLPQPMAVVEAAVQLRLDRWAIRRLVVLEVLVLTLILLGHLQLQLVLAVTMPAVEAVELTMLFILLAAAVLAVVATGALVL
jgi:hypothetical protein